MAYHRDPEKYFHLAVAEYGNSRLPNGPIVTTTDGKIQGSILKSVYGPEYLAFTRIPYGKPPIGPLRFQAPQPASKWEGVLDGSKQGFFPLHCVPDSDYPEVGGSEDCLTVNVYTKSIDSCRKKPVIFFVPGAGFLYASNHEGSCRYDYLITQNIVLVSVNYRQGPLGFLNLGHELASGNQGIRDVILALRWTRKNIEAFGGDPENITIMGSSAGSYTCHLLTLIPSTKGLFQKAILMSGLIFMVRSLMKKSKYKNGFRIAHLLGMDSDDPVEVLKFLQTVPARQLMAVEPDILSERESTILHMWPYEPVYDAEFSKDPLIPKPFPELLQNNAEVPIIIGNTSDEYLLDCMGKLDDDKFFKYHNFNIEEIVKNRLLVEDWNKFSPIMEDIRGIYLKNEPISKDRAWRLIRLFTDLIHMNWNRTVIDVRNQHAKAPTYHYNFSYSGDQPTCYQFDLGPQPLQGIAHADDMSYVLYFTYMRIKMGEEVYPQEGTLDRIVSERLVRMFYNFAAFGNPTPQTDDTYLTTVWKPTTEENLFYLDIGENLILKDDLDSESRAFYDKIKEVYRV